MLSTYDVSHHQGMTMAMDIWMYRTGNIWMKGTKGVLHDDTSPHLASPNLTSRRCTIDQAERRQRRKRIHGDSFQLSLDPWTQWKRRVSLPLKTVSSR